MAIFEAWKGRALNLLCFALALVMLPVATGNGASLTIVSLGTIFSIWFVVRRGVLSVELLSALLSFLILPWLYRYGQHGFEFLVIPLVLNFRRGRWVVPENATRDRSLEYGAWVYAAGSLIGAAIRGGHLDDLTIELPTVLLVLATVYLPLSVSKFDRVLLRSLAVFFLCVATLVILILRDDYSYFFMGEVPYVVHPEFVGTLYGVVLCCAVWLLVCRISRGLIFCAFLCCAALLLIALLPGLPIGGQWLFAAPLKMFQSLSAVEILTGQGSAWRDHLQTVLALGARYPRAQFPLPAWSTLVFSGGILKLLGFLFLLIQAVFSFKKFPARVLASVMGLLFLALPGGTEAVLLMLSVLLIRLLQSNQSKPEEHFLVSTRLERAGMVLVGIGCVVCVGFLILNVTLSFQRLVQGPKVSPPTTPTQLTSNLVLELLIAEDLLFFEHRGVDFSQVKQATLQLLRSGAVDRGASTITMQLAKLVYLEFDKTLARKVQQGLLALYLEQRLTKSEILAWYIRALDFGREVGFGTQRASQQYFGKSPAELSREESRKLVLTIKDPAHYNPTVAVYPEDVQVRLGQMVLKEHRWGGFLLPAVCSLKYVSCQQAH